MPNVQFDVEDEPGFAAELGDKFLGDTNGKPTETKKERAPGIPRATPLEKKLERFYTSIGAVVYAFDPQCGTVVIENASNMASSLDGLAKANPQVKKVLEKLVETSAIGIVVAAHAPVALAIASHHVPKVQEVMAGMAERMNPVDEYEMPI